ncbi:MAG: hypothetical protein HUK05_02065 [Prevotella sp.]|nr:hypothetical protein [Prevotella sp.]
MKTLKYLAASAMLAICSAANAQDIKTDLANLEQVVKANSGNPAAYKANLKAMDKLYKKDPEALTKISKLFYQYDDTLNSRLYAEKAIAIVEKKKLRLCEPFIILGDLRYIDGDPGTAASWYERAKMNDDKNAKAYEKVAGVYRKANPKAAVDQLKELEAIDPTYPANAVAAGFYYDAALAGNTKYWANALDLYKKEDLSKFREEDYPRYVYVLYRFKNYKGMLEDCIDVADKALQKYPDDVTCNRYKMYALELQGQHADAVAAGEKLFKCEKYVEYPDDYKVLGQAYCGSQDWDKAEEALNKSLSLKEDQPEISKYKSEIAYAKGDTIQGLQLLETYVQTYEDADLTDYLSLTRKYDDTIGDMEVSAEKVELQKKQNAIFDTMLEKFPGKQLLYIYFKKAKLADAIDPTGASAAPLYEKFIETAQAEDAVKHKNLIVSTSKKLADYYTKSGNTTKAAYFEELAK